MKVVPALSSGMILGVTSTEPQPLQENWTLYSFKIGSRIYLDRFYSKRGWFATRSVWYCIFEEENKLCCAPALWVSQFSFIWATSCPHNKNTEKKPFGVFKWNACQSAPSKNIGCKWSFRLFTRMSMPIVNSALRFCLFYVKIFLAVVWFCGFLKQYCKKFITIYFLHVVGGGGEDDSQ